VTHPTDAELMLKAIEQLAKLARAHGISLRQSYVRVAKAPRQSPDLHCKPSFIALVRPLKIHRRSLDLV